MSKWKKQTKKTECQKTRLVGWGLNKQAFCSGAWQPSIQFWLISELSAMRNIHWFPIYVHLSRLTRLSKSRSLMVVTHVRCFEAANLFRVTWAVMSLKWIGLSTSQYQLELANHRRWFSSFNKSERVKIAHYLVRNLAGSWSQDKKKTLSLCPT